jgi:hypothetical protein
MAERDHHQRLLEHQTYLDRLRLIPTRRDIFEVKLI